MRNLCLATALAVLCAIVPVQAASVLDDWKPMPCCSYPNGGDGGESFLFHDNALWILKEDKKHRYGYGALLSMDLASNTVTIRQDRNVVAMRAIGGTLWILRARNPNTRTLALSQWNGTAFEDVEFVPPSERPWRWVNTTLVDADGTPGVVAWGWLRILSPATQHWMTTRWDRPETMVGMGYPTALVMPGRREAYIGFSTGEWGGALFHVDLPSGRTTEVKPKEPFAEFCDAVCFGVNKMIVDPLRPGCVIVPTGSGSLQGGGGALLRACGRIASIILNPPSDYLLYRGQLFDDALPDTKGAYWVSSEKKIYRIAADKVDAFDYPKASLEPGLHRNDDLPGLPIYTFNGFGPIFDRRPHD